VTDASIEKDVGMNEADRVSIIVPAYNASSTLDRCLNALMAQTRAPDEIIVIDDGSTDDTAQIAASYGVRVVRQDNQGPAAARNRGVEVSTGDLLLFTDSDCAPVDGWVAQMVAALADPAIAGVRGAYLTKQRSLVARFVQLEYEDRYRRMRGRRSIDFVDTYSAGYRRPVFEAVHGFDESLRIDEDQELSFRISEAGYRLTFAPDAQVYHIHDESIGEYVRRKFHIGYWKTRVLRAHPDKLIRDSHTPQVLKLQITLAGLGALLIVLGWINVGFVWIGLAVWGGILVSSLPFLVRLLRRDPPVVLVAPLLIFVRAWALGLGLVSGGLDLLAARLR
jgi:glycosyltransferase involved in cell wall biosynthesis